MKYNFDKIIDRKNTDSIKWDRAGDALPMWVADMDFETYPGIKEALVNRATHGIFGYTENKKEWYESYMYWWREKYSFDIKKEWLNFSNGVMPALACAVRALSEKGDNVLVQSPVYSAFFSTIFGNERNVVENKLIYNELSYDIDWVDLEERLSDSKTKLMILCNPHNPTGNIWNEQILIRIGELCKKNGVIVISDEIHCDIVAPGEKYVPFAAVSEVNKDISVTLISPAKTFNVSAIHSAAMIIANDEIKNKVKYEVGISGVGRANSFSIEVVKAAYTKEGAEWVDELCEYIWNNRNFAEKYIKENIPNLKTVPSHSTYLLWVDVSAVADNSDKFVRFLEKEAKLMLNSGSDFFGNGDKFVRINLACPMEVLKDGLNRLKEGTESYKERS